MVTLRRSKQYDHLPILGSTQNCPFPGSAVVGADGFAYSKPFRNAYRRLLSLFNPFRTGFGVSGSHYYYYQKTGIPMLTSNSGAGFVVNVKGIFVDVKRVLIAKQVLFAPRFWGYSVLD